LSSGVWRTIPAKSLARAALTSRAGVRSVIQSEINAKRDLVLKTTLLQAAALLCHDEPGKVMQGLARTVNGYFDGVCKALVGSPDDFDSFEHSVCHESFLLERVMAIKNLTVLYGVNPVEARCLDCDE
jgi:hypothetical protein